MRGDVEVIVKALQLNPLQQFSFRKNFSLSLKLPVVPVTAVKSDSRKHLITGKQLTVSLLKSMGGIGVDAESMDDEEVCGLEAVSTVFNLNPLSMIVVKQGDSISQVLDDDSCKIAVQPTRLNPQKTRDQAIEYGSPWKLTVALPLFDKAANVSLSKRITLYQGVYIAVNRLESLSKDRLVHSIASRTPQYIELLQHTSLTSACASGVYSWSECSEEFYRNAGIQFVAHSDLAVTLAASKDLRTSKIARKSGKTMQAYNKASKSAYVVYLI
jgi:hypothetical protein